MPNDKQRIEINVRVKRAMAERENLTQRRKDAKGRGKANISQKVTEATEEEDCERHALSKHLARRTEWWSNGALGQWNCWTVARQEL